MHKDIDLAAVEFGIERVEARIADVNAVLVGEQDDAIGLQHVERIGQGRQRAIDIGKRQRREEAEF